MFQLTIHFISEVTLLNSDKYIRGLKNGDKAVFEEIYREYYTKLCYYTIRYVENLPDAEEIVQMVFVNLWEKRKELDIKTSLSSYLYKACGNSALNLLKRQKVSENYLASQEALSGVSFDDGLKTLEEEEFRKKIKEAILELPEKRREIFEMSRFEGMKYNKIADQLSISVKTVENQMSKALKFLRVALKDYTPVIAVALEVLRSIGMTK